MSDDANKRLEEWNKAISDFEAMAQGLRHDAIQRGGWKRKPFLWLLRFAEKWIARGRRWRAEDME